MLSPAKSEAAQPYPLEGFSIGLARLRVPPGGPVVFPAPFLQVRTQIGRLAEEVWARATPRGA